MYFKKTGFSSLEVIAKGKNGTSPVLFLTGFTLVEVLVASTIGAFIALVAVGALRAVTASAELVEDNISVAAELRFALNTISKDLMNLYRDPNYANTRFIGLAEEAEDGYNSNLIFYTVSRTKARNSQPEGDVYEVEYNLVRDEERSVLTRRYWPYPDKEETEPHGILTVLAEDISIFQVRYYDGEDWTYEWPEEMEILPQLVEVSIAARQPGQKKPIVESFIVHFIRSTSMTGVESEISGGAESSIGDMPQSGASSSTGGSGMEIGSSGR
jgi:general secretion pathway protein J